MSSIKWLAIARPNPVPPCRRVVEPSACSKGSKIRSSFCSGMPTPVSLTVKTMRRVTAGPSPGAISTVTTNLALLGELDGVADQVDEHLPQPAGSPTRTSGTSARIRQASSSPFCWARRASVSIVSLDHVAQVEGDRSRTSLPRLDLGEVEDVVDDGQQDSAELAHDLQVFALLAASDRYPAPARSCRSRRSWACGSRGSCWPGTRSWPGWRPRRPSAQALRFVIRRRRAIPRVTSSATVSRAAITSGDGRRRAKMIRTPSRAAPEPSGSPMTAHKL